VPWFAWRYAPALTNDEPNWTIYSGDRDLASVRPWHGFYAVVGQGGERTPAVMETWEPRFVRATVGNTTGDVIVRHAAYSTPPYMITKRVTTTGDCDQPCLAEDPRLSAGLILLYTRTPTSGPDIQGAYERRSHDCAATWENEAVAFASIGDRVVRDPKVRTGDMAVVRAAFRYDDADSGPGKIVATYQGDGDEDQSAEFAWKDEALSDLAVADTGYDYCQATDEQERWLASLTIAGEGTTSDWFSTDGCRTWRRI
jgi:hypothetical protein